jgi:enoyl-CoA hydratase/carnithine racemase
MSHASAGLPEPDRGYAGPATDAAPVDCGAFDPGTDRLAVRREGRVVVVELADPDRRNMMGRELTAAWGRLIPAIAADRSVGAVLLTGRGTAFSSGGDTTWVGPGPHESVAGLRERMLDFYRTWLAVRELDVPTMAALNGPAIGAGAALALACDIRWAAETAFLSVPFLRMGMHPGMLATHLLADVAGPAVARDLLLTGRRVPAAEMLSLGLVTRVLPDAELPAAATRAASDLAAGAPVAVRLAKAALRDVGQRTWSDALQWEGLAQAVTLATDDLVEGMAALREKRSPRFRGR